MYMFIVNSQSSKFTVHNFDLQYKGKGGLTNLMRKRLTSAPRRAINMWSKVADQKNSGREAILEQVLIKGPHHCFGIHTHAKCKMRTVVDVQEIQLQDTIQYIG